MDNVSVKLPAGNPTAIFLISIRSSSITRRISNLIQSDNGPREPRSFRIEEYSTVRGTLRVLSVKSGEPARKSPARSSRPTVELPPAGIMIPCHDQAQPESTPVRKSAVTLRHLFIFQLVQIPYQYVDTFETSGYERAMIEKPCVEPFV
jgi:hypothetical protein